MEKILLSFALTALFIVLSLLAAPKILRQKISMKVQFLLDVFYVVGIFFLSSHLQDMNAALVVLVNVLVCVAAANIFLRRKKRKHNPEQPFEVTPELLEQETAILDETWRREKVLKKLREEANSKRKQYLDWYAIFSVSLLLMTILAVMVRNFI